jgi:hypothetical protein
MVGLCHLQCIAFDHVLYLLYLECYDSAGSMNVGSCHHGMARPQVVDGGTASNMEGSCEYTE